MTRSPPRFPGFLALLLIALALRLAVPPGFMLADSGAFALVPCPAAAPVIEAVPEPEHHAHHAHHADKQAPTRDDPGEGCPYAALAAPALVPAPPASLAAVWLVPIRLASAARALPRQPGPAAPPPPARGPPTLS